MVCFVLPAYNEEKSIAILLNRIEEVFGIEKVDYKIIIVNDGSTDLTSKILESFRKKNNKITVIDHGINKGLGEAIKTGLKDAIRNLDEKDIIVTMDSDNTHDPSLVFEMVKKIEQDRKNVVIASRFIKGGKEIGLAFHRKILSRGACLFFKIFMPIKGVNDYSSGYRAYSVDFLDKAFKVYGEKIIETSGFDCMAELLAKLSRLSLNVSEVPLVLRYDMKATPGKMNIFKTIKGYFSVINRARRFPVNKSESFSHLETNFKVDNT